MKIIFSLIILHWFHFGLIDSSHTSSISVANYRKLASEARQNGDFELSIELLSKCRSISNSHEDLMKVYNSLGSSYYKLTDFHTALHYFDSAYVLIDTTEPSDFLSIIYHNYGLVHMEFNNFKKAIMYFSKALDNINDNHKGVLYYNMAMCYGFLNNTEEAKRNYHLSYEYNCKVYSKNSYYSIITGIKLVELGEDMLEDLFEAIKTLDSRLLYGLYYSLSKDYDKAEAYLEENHYELLQVYVKSHQWHKAVPLIDSLRSSYLSLDSKLFLQKNEMLIYKSAIDSALKKDTLKAFQFAQKSHGNILRERTGSNISQLKESYNYFDFDSVIYHFQVSTDQIMFYKINAGDEFWEKFHLFLNTIKADSSIDQNYYQNYKNFCESSHYLFKKLCLSTSDNMLIVPSGKLQYLAFECLLTEFPADTSLPDYKNLSYLIKQSSIHYDYILREYPTGKGKKNIIAFAPDTNLKFAIEEVNDLKIFSSKRLIGQHAKLGLINDGDILHIATHYSPKDYNIKFYDSTLNLNNLKFKHRDMVVLSTCQSGEGKLHYGEGIFSPGRSFYIAGAESIIESMWNASDAPTYYVIWNFYKNLLFRKDKATALRNAKLDYLEKCPHHMSQPFFWANYRIFGNSSVIRIRLNPIITIALTSLIILLVIFIKYLFSRKRKLPL